MRVLAPAKINLHLRVGKPRGDGFHPVSTWMVTVGLFDTLLIDRSQPGEPPDVHPGLRLTCDMPGLPCDASNLIARAVVAFTGALEAENRGWENPAGAMVRLLKRIPVGAGLGGGSSDAARTLVALNVLWQTGWSDSRLAGLSASLGSDLPFFFHHPSAVCRGRGERVGAISPPRPRWALLILPGTPMPTPAVYRRFDEMGLGSDASQAGEPDWKAWARLPATELLPLLVNDLEQPAFAIDPELALLRRSLEQRVGRPVRMSGSGSSLFTLYDADEQVQAEAAEALIGKSLAAKAVVTEVAPMLLDDINNIGG